METWFDIKGHSSYAISNEGRVKKKEYFQIYKKHNPECGRPPFSKCKRRCGERIISPTYRGGRVSFRIDGIFIDKEELLKNCK